MMILGHCADLLDAEQLQTLILIEEVVHQNSEFGIQSTHRPVPGGFQRNYPLWQRILRRSTKDITVLWRALENPVIEPSGTDEAGNGNYRFSPECPGRHYLGPCLGLSQHHWSAFAASNPGWEGSSG